MLDGILHVILKPVDFFRKLLDDDKVASRAFGVVLIVMVLAGVYGYFVALPTADAIANTPFGAFGLITTPVSFVVISLLSWLIFGLLVRMAAGISIKPWAITGYSLSPQIIIYALLIILAVLFPVKLSPVTVDPTKEPEAFQEAMISLQQESQQTVFGRSSQNFELSLEPLVGRADISGCTRSSQYSQSHYKCAGGRYSNRTT